MLVLVLVFLTSRRDSLTNVMAKEASRDGFVVVVLTLGPIEPGGAIGVDDGEGLFLPNFKVLVSEE